MFEIGATVELHIGQSSFFFSFYSDPKEHKEEGIWVVLVLFCS